MKFSINTWNFETITRNGFTSHQTTCTVIFGSPGIVDLQKNGLKMQKNAQKMTKIQRFLGSLARNFQTAHENCAKIFVL